jgi:hypothetical protein
MVTDRRVRRAVFETTSALILGVAAVSAPIALAPAAQAASGSLGPIWAGNVNSDPGATFDYSMTCYAAEATNGLAVTVSHPADGSVGAVMITSQYLTCDGSNHVVAISVNSNKSGAWKVGDKVNVEVAQVDASGRALPGATSTAKTTLATPPGN